MALRGHLPLHLALGPQPMALRAFRHLPSPTCDETCRVETLHGRNASGCVFDQIHATQRVVAAGRRWLTQIGTRFRSRLPTANLAPQSVTPSRQACGIPPRNRPPSTTPTARRFFRCSMCPSPEASARLGKHLLPVGDQSEMVLTQKPMTESCKELNGEVTEVYPTITSNMKTSSTWMFGTTFGTSIDIVQL